MNIFRTTLITILVTAASVAALLIPINISTNSEQPQRATGATIPLVDSLPSVKTNIPSAPEQPKVISVKTKLVEPSISEPSPAGAEPLPSSDDGVVPIETLVTPEVVIEPETKPLPASVEATEQNIPKPEEEQPTTSLDESAATEESIASVAASAIASDPLPSLVDGYYEATKTDQAPSFDRTSLTSRIRYPALAKRQGIEGLVMLRLFISASGKVERIEVEEDPGYGLAEAAVKAFTGLQGEPAVLGGKAVPVTLRYPVRFSLK